MFKFLYNNNCLYSKYVNPSSAQFHLVQADQGKKLYIVFAMIFFADAATSNDTHFTVLERARRTHRRGNFGDLGWVAGHTHVNVS